MLELYGEDPTGRRGRYWLRRAAELGSAEGEREWAVDLNCRNKWPEALQWYRRAAERGNAEYQNFLGEIYRDGEPGVRVDKREAVRWFRRAAERGSLSARLNYGFALFYSEGVRRDRIAAKELYEGVARSQPYYRWEHKDTRARAMCNLGIMHEYGQGIPKDIDKALYWYRRAARIAPEDFMERPVKGVALIYDGASGRRVDHGLAVKWLRRGVEVGSRECQWRLGYRYLCGKGVRPDTDRGVAMIRASAERGRYEAQYLLGILYREGDGLRRNRRVAESWFKKSGVSKRSNEGRELENLLA